MADRTPSRSLAYALYGGTAAAALVAPRLVDRLSRRVPPPVAELAVTSGLIGVGFVAVATAEQARPHHKEWNRSDGAELTDLFDTAVAASAALVLGTTITAPIRALATRGGSGSLLARLPLPARVAVSIVVSDLFHSSLHRLVHEWEPLWRFHAVHHSMRRLRGFNAGRFHPIEATLVMVGDNVVLSLLGLDGRAGASHRVLRTVFGQIQHSNVDLDSGPLNAVLSTPERHRWHHSPVRDERDSNYGSVVCLWDKVFGTDLLPADRSVGPDIGVEELANFPQDIIGQLAAPFRLDGLRGGPTGDRLT